MDCSNNIVMCLRDLNYAPEATSSSFFDKSNVAENALVFDTTNSFTSASQGKIQWLAIDLKRAVSINSYKIKSETPITEHSWIYSWSISVSRDNKTWTFADRPDAGDPGDKIFYFKKPINLRYFRIESVSKYYGDLTRIRFYYIQLIGSLALVRDNCFISCRCNRGLNTKLVLFVLIQCN